MGALNTDTVVPNLCVCFHKINLLVDSKYDQYNSALKKMLTYSSLYIL